MDARRNDLAALLQEVLDTLEAAGTLEAWSCADDDSGLPFVWDKLKRARDMAISPSDGPSPRLQ